MASYITEKYAGILTKEDVGQLFTSLTENLRGNRLRAARQCGLTGKATYDWEGASYLKLRTKQKVLEACLRTNFFATVEFLLRRSNDRTVDILHTILSTIYTEAMETDSKVQFTLLLDRFEVLRKKHRGLIRDQIEDEVNDMVWFIGERASEFGVPQSPRSLEDVALREWLATFPAIADAWLENPQQARALATTLLPRESVEVIWSTFEKLRRPGKITTRAEAGKHFLGKPVPEVYVWFGEGEWLGEDIVAGGKWDKSKKKPVLPTVAADDYQR